MIEHTNIFWVGSLNVIGGVETFIYELAKKFKNYDLLILYKSIPKEQLRRLRKYVKSIKYDNQKIKCKKLFMNYDISIIDNVEAEEYIEIIHCVFKHNILEPHTHPKIDKYYAVGQEACDSFKEITGLGCEVLHNPLDIDKPKKILKLLSATRLDSDKGKVLERTRKLANELEKNNIPYRWLIFTTSDDKLKNPNITFMKPQLDIRNYIADTDYLVQLSDTEAFCYSVLESLYLNTPVIVTPIPCFIDEMGVKNEINGYILDFNMEAIPTKDIYNKIPKFEYKPLKDEWEDKIIKIKSNYKNEMEENMKARVIQGFNDKYTGTYYEENKILNITRERFEEILEVGKLVEEIKEEIPTIENVDKTLEKIHESAKEEVELNQFGNPIGTREIKAKKETKKKKK